MLASLQVADLLPDRSLLYIIGCSGGADSVVLLHHYRDLFKAGLMDYEPIVFHLNHGLRLSAGKDAEFVRRLASELDLPFYVDTIRLRTFAKRSRLNLEEAGRLARYRRMQQIGQIYELPFVAVTAHHSDDYAESVFLKILRGATDRAFFMPALTEMAVKPLKLKLFRPFLKVSRAQIEEYAAQNNIAYRNDLSNDSDTFLRNRLRHRLIPVLKDEGFDPSSVWSRIHSGSRFAVRPAESVPGLDWLMLPMDLFTGAATFEVKQVLDRALSRLRLLPLQGSSSSGILSEILRQSVTKGKIHVSTKEWHLVSIADQIWLIRADAEILYRPDYMQEGSSLIVKTKYRKFRFELGEGESIGFYEPGIRTVTGKKMKLVFYDQKIPSLIRNSIPFIVVKGRVVRVLSCVLGRANLDFRVITDDKAVTS